MESSAFIFVDFVSAFQLVEDAVLLFLTKRQILLLLVFPLRCTIRVGFASVCPRLSVLMEDFVHVLNMVEGYEDMVSYKVIILSEMFSL